MFVASVAATALPGSTARQTSAAAMMTMRALSTFLSSAVRARAAAQTGRSGGFYGQRSVATTQPVLTPVVAHRPLGFACHLALADRLALVAPVLASGQRDLDLRHRPREVDPRRHDRQPALGRLADQPLDLALVEQELAVALGVVVGARRRPVRRDVDVVQPHLAALDGGVAVLELGAPLAQRL